MNLVDIPKKFWYTLLNYGGLLYTWGSILLIFSVNVYFTCPVLEPDRFPYFLAFGIFLMFQITTNFVCFHYFAYLNRVDYIFPSNVLPVATVLPDGTLELPACDPKTTKYCFNCHHMVPIRSHHCPVCKYCVLRKDHHCFLTGACVGFGNQRYFVIFLFWCGVGSLFGAWITGRFMNAYYTPFFPFGFIDYIFPVAFKRWMFFQHITVVELGYAIVFSSGFAGGLASLIFFILQMQLILKGQTLYEMTRNDTAAIHPGRMPIGLRMECVFGRYWYGNFLFPLPFRNRMDDAFQRLIHESHLKEM